MIKEFHKHIKLLIEDLVKLDSKIEDFIIKYDKSGIDYIEQVMFNMREAQWKIKDSLYIINVEHGIIPNRD